MKRHLFSAVGAVVLGALSSPAMAQAVNYEGTIRNVITSGSTNFAFRVALEPAMPECTGNFAYINVDDANYQAKTATLLTAYALNKSVTLTVIYVQVQGIQRCILQDTVVGER